jgi:acetyl-CoA carboxylase biotin carboxylase subunit
MIHLGERECSVQRRHQTSIEEAPSPAVDVDLRRAMGEAAVKLASTIAYQGAGTVEFILDDAGDFYFLEMNTRLQVEHAVTEMVTATDLVRWQLEVAAGASLGDDPPLRRGHAIECRVYAEDPAKSFLPTAGRIRRVEHPSGPGVRVDSALYDGFEVPIQYDPLLAKVIAWAPDRDHCIARMLRALEEFSILGVTTNIAFLIDVLRDRAFAVGGYKTTTVEQVYGEWTRDTEPDQEIVGAAAAILVGHRSSPPTGQVGAAAAQELGPWQTLGAWRLGDGKV